jgi:putative CocE/NonD family hydrolase
MRRWLSPFRLAPLLLAHGLRHTLPRIYRQVPIAEIGERGFGQQVPVEEWLRELAPDSPMWAGRDFSSSVGNVRAPVQLIGGWYDIFLPWQLEDYRTLRDGGHDPQLIIGPWTHMSPELAGLSLREGIGWMRAHLLGDDRMVSDDPVRVFVTGEGRWRTLPDWPPPSATPRTFYLQPGGGLGDSPPAKGAEPSRYRYDPARPTPALGGPVLLRQRPSYVEIDMSRQHLWFYKNGALITQGDIVTGNISANNGTPAGIYKLKYKEKNACIFFLRLQTIALKE